MVIFSIYNTRLLVFILFCTESLNIRKPIISFLELIMFDAVQVATFFQFCLNFLQQLTVESIWRPGLVSQSISALNQYISRVKTLFSFETLHLQNISTRFLFVQFFLIMIISRS